MQTLEKRSGGWAGAAEFVTILIGAGALLASLGILVARGVPSRQDPSFNALLLLFGTVVIAGIILLYRHLGRRRIQLRSEEAVEKQVKAKVEKKMDEWMGGES